MGNSPEGPGRPRGLARVEDEIEARLIFLKAQRSAAWGKMTTAPTPESVALWTAKNNEIYSLEKSREELRGQCAQRKRLPCSEPQKRGRKPKTLARVVGQMRRDVESNYDLMGAKGEELAEKYGASRETCQKARGLVLGLSVEN